MSKFLLTSSVLIIGLASAQSASATDVETKLIFNSDTGVESSISQNPKVVAESATSATKPVVKAIGTQGNTNTSVGIGSIAQTGVNVQSNTAIDTNARTPQPVLNSSLADSVPREEEALEENAGAVAKGEVYNENSMTASSKLQKQEGDVEYVKPDVDVSGGVQIDADNMASGDVEDPSVAQDSAVSTSTSSRINVE